MSIDDVDLLLNFSEDLEKGYLRIAVIGRSKNSKVIRYKIAARLENMIPVLLENEIYQYHIDLNQSQYFKLSLKGDDIEQVKISVSSHVNLYVSRERLCKYQDEFRCSSDLYKGDEDKPIIYTANNKTNLSGLYFIGVSSYRSTPYSIQAIVKRKDRLPPIVIIKKELYNNI